jgi:hypothetical protein
MIRSTAILVAMLSIGGVNRLYAQEATPGPGTLEVTVIPAGGTFFTSGNSASSFGNYNVGGALTYNINRVVGLEGEVSSSLGIAQDLQFGGLSAHHKTPKHAVVHRQSGPLAAHRLLVCSIRHRRDWRAHDVQ